MVSGVCLSVIGLFLKIARHRGYGVARQIRNLTIAWIVTINAAVADEPVIVALGDSLTQGYGLDVKDGFTVQLEAWLRANGHPAVVQNAGVSGDTTAGGLARVDWALGPETDALIVTLGGNDMLRGIDPASSRANLDGILHEAQARKLPVLLIGMPAPGNFGAAYKTEFDAMYPELAATYGTLLADSFFAGLMDAGADPSDPVTMAAFLQADGIHPNPEGVKLIVGHLGPQVVALMDRVVQ
jgi:acyl-CoA thioesterase I